MYNILSILPKYEGRRQIVRQSQNVGDIMQGILQTHKIYSSHYDKIAASFWKGTTLKTARAIYNFLAVNTYYRVEPDDRQTLRSPSAILYLGGNRNIGLDCKSYALFTAGILDALRRQGKKIDFCYRFASYRITDKLPHHVFVVINPDSNNEIWVDNVLQSFNEKKYPSYKIDKKTMLESISGIGRRPKKTKAERKAKIKAAIKKRGKFLLKFNPATASSRNAFLLLVKLNVFGLAHKLLQVYKKNPDKLKKFWEKIGGSYSNLQKNIAQGIKKGKHKGTDTMNGIGFVPQAAAAIAASTPIILKVTSFLKENGINPDELINAGKKLVGKILDKKIDEQADKEAASEGDQESTGEEGGDDTSGENTGGEDAMSGQYPSSIQVRKHAVKRCRCIKPFADTKKNKIGNYA